MWIEALRRDATIVLVTPEETTPPEGVEVEAVHASRAELLKGIGRVLMHRAPFHTILATPWDWRAALCRAEERHGTFDVAIVLLTRTDPVVYRFLPARRRILDAIDSAARGMRERAGAARSTPARLFWSWDAWRARALEQSAARRYDAIVTVAPEESAAFGERATTIAMDVEVAPVNGPAKTGARRYDFGFWGRFPYFANEQAVRTLLDVIWPEIRRRRPESTLFVGGAEAPRWLRALDGRDGIAVVSPVEDRGEALRQVRVALLPVLRGTGQSLKTLEAAEAACAIIGTSTAFRGFSSLAEAAVIEDDLRRFAERAVILLENGHAAVGQRLREIVVAQHDRAQSLERMRALVLGGA
jgi:hypothetical protein